MQIVKIGNDVWYNIALSSNGSTNLKIKSASAYFINKTKYADAIACNARELAAIQNEAESRQGKIKYVSRFPIEPYPTDFCPSPYDVCNSGRPCYHTFPHYHGFGVFPHTFERCVWEKDHMYDLHKRAELEFAESKREFDKCKVVVPVDFRDDSNIVKVYFPAVSLIYTGIYNLIIVAKVEDSTYTRTNERTITMEYEDFVKIVTAFDDESDNGDGTGSDTIDVGNVPRVTSVSINGENIVTEGQTLVLTATVSPSNTLDSSVTWSTSGVDDYITLKYSTGNSYVFLANDLPSGVGSISFTVTATSRNNNNISDSKVIKIIKSTGSDTPVSPGESNEDNYVTDGSYSNSTLSLNMKTGDDVEVYLNPAEDWGTPYTNN